MKQCPSALARDNWLLHKIDPTVGDHLASCPNCTGLAVGHKRIEDDFRNSQMMALIARVEGLSREKVSSKANAWRLWWIALPVVAAAVVFAAPNVWKSSRSSQFYVGAKGSPQLDVVVKRNGKVFPLSEGKLVAAQDQLAFVPRGLPQGYRFFSLGTLSAGGYISLYPAKLDESFLPLPERNEALPGSVTIDDSPEDERLFVAFAKHQFSAGWAAKLSQIAIHSELRFVQYEGQDAIAGWIVLGKK